MLIQSWSQVFLLSLQGLWYGFIETFPRILLAIVIFIIGWIVANTLGKLVMMGIDSLKLDRGFKSTGVDEALARAGTLRLARDHAPLDRCCRCSGIILVGLRHGSRDRTASGDAVVAESGGGDGAFGVR